MLEPLKKPWLEKGEKLLCFGDSLTVADPGYVSILREKLGAQGIEVVNSGRGGDKTPWALTRLEKDVMQSGADAISIFFGANDVEVGRGVWADEPTVTSETYKGCLVWMVHLCRLYSKIHKFSITTPAWRLEGNEYIAYGDIMLDYCLKAREAADQMHTFLVPLDTVFSLAWEKNIGRISAEGKIFTKDGVHMTQEGYAMIADAMLRTWGLD